MKCQLHNLSAKIDMQLTNGRVYEMSLYEVKNDLITPFRLIDSRFISYGKVLTRSLEDCKSDNNLTIFSGDNQNGSQTK